MKHFMVLLLLVTSTLSLYGSNDDLTRSKGTDQEVILQLSPTVAQTDVWNNAKIEVSFSVPLDTSAIQKHNVKLTHLSSKTNDHIDGTITYDRFDNKLLFTPNVLLPHGTYEVEVKSLKADKAYKSTQIKEIKYRFYVPEVINGHQLPPEPDPVVNDSTLLGIDANANGVRDDVEIWIIDRYKDEKSFPKSKTAIAMQYAKATQVIIQEPEKAYENKTYGLMDNAQDCAWYLLESNRDRMTFEEIRIFDSEMKDKIFNTKKRLINYAKYNSALGGHIFSGPIHYTVDFCDVNIDDFAE